MFKMATIMYKLKNSVLNVRKAAYMYIFSFIVGVHVNMKRRLLQIHIQQ